MTVDAEARPAAGGGETILVVEDDASVRAFTASALNALGYKTLEAGDARAALGVLGGSPEIALVLSDVVLPHGMSGVELCRNIRRQRPSVKVLLTSGYAEEIVAGHGTPRQGRSPHHQAVPRRGACVRSPRRARPRSPAAARF